MMLVATSVWIDHLRQGDAALIAALDTGRVLRHPFIVGELACGHLRSRAEVLGLMQSLPKISVATDQEVLYFIDSQALMGRGIVYVDAHLLASVRLSGTHLWTRDKRLHTIASDLGLAQPEMRH